MNRIFALLTLFNSYEGHLHNVVMAYVIQSSRACLQSRETACLSASHTCFVSTVRNLRSRARVHIWRSGIAMHLASSHLRAEYSFGFQCQIHPKCNAKKKASKEVRA